MIMLVTLMMYFNITSTTIYYMAMKNNIFLLLFLIYLFNYQHVNYSSYNAIDGDFRNINLSPSPWEYPRLYGVRPFDSTMI